LVGTENGGRPPLTYEVPKGLLEVHGKPMLERQIEQLLEVGISEIVIVVGYMKEAFDYLIDKYGVTLVFNPDYATKNNLFSLKCVLPYLKNSYVLMADNWIEENIFNAEEGLSWFSVLKFEGETDEWCLEHDSDGRMTKLSIGGADSLAIVGPAFFNETFSQRFKEFVEEYASKPGTDDFYWEHILLEHLDELPMYINEQSGNVYEFESLSELRAYDASYINDSGSSIMAHITRVFGVTESCIEDIYPLKEGVTNNSFHFAVAGKEYVLRVPGIGTDKQINRYNEKQVYEAITPLGISDEIVDFDAESGIKITNFWHDVRSADPLDDNDLQISMSQIKKVHDLSIQLDRRFDIKNMIEDYYSLAESVNAIRFRDIEQTREKLNELYELQERLAVPEILCHGDYAHINILMLPDGSGKVIDWEFSGMADPIMDVAMYSIFAELDPERIDLCLRMYIGGDPSENEWTRMYLYVALGGFLWSMWAEYKQALGQEFGEYPMTMYRYMKDYYKLMKERGMLE
jgi:CTP:phosphocholine cytidylyltransferase-like protein/thiamine kinase-like enzyme